MKKTLLILTLIISFGCATSSSYIALSDRSNMGFKTGVGVGVTGDTKGSTVVGTVEIFGMYEPKKAASSGYTYSATAGFKVPIDQWWVGLGAAHSGYHSKVGDGIWSRTRTGGYIELGKSVDEYSLRLRWFPSVDQDNSVIDSKAGELLLTGSWWRLTVGNHWWVQDKARSGSYVIAGVGWQIK